jgi:hypothetical protein
MSKIIEYRNKYYKISEKVLDIFNVYTLEERNIGINLLCNYMDDFFNNREKNKLYYDKLIYNNPIFEFGNLDKSYKNKLINKVLLDINKIKTFNNNNNIIKKLNDYIES